MIGRQLGKRSVLHAVAAGVLALAVLMGSRDVDAAQRPHVAGSGVAPSDFNGDGYSDLAIGSPYEDVGSISDAGGVDVLHGSALGLQASSPAAQFWTQDDPGLGGQAEQGDRFGHALAGGDFDGDGYADLAIGAPSEDVGAALDAGAVTVLYGSEGGLQSFSPDDQEWTQNSAGVGDVSESGDLFGHSLAGGDFNADGFADLAVGIPGEDVVGAQGAGAVATLYGSPEGLQAVLPNDQVWGQNSPGVQDVAETDDQFGHALATGDFDADGYADLAVGVPYEDVGTTTDGGIVHLLYGSAAGLQANEPADQRWIQGRGGVDDTVERRDHFGFSVSSGDFNGDGYSDLVAGVPGENVLGEDGDVVANAGAANILHGSAVGLQTAAPADQFWHQDVPGVIGLAESPDQFGYSVASEDLDGDGYHDLAVGVRGEDGGPETVHRSGAVNILYGSAGGVQTMRDWHLDQDGPEVTDQAEDDDHFGFSVAMADLNGDGFAELAVGVAGEDLETIDVAGTAHVLYGNSGGLQALSPDDQFWTQDADGMGDSAESGDQMGFAVFAAGE
jgi:hypothetical protein